MRFRPLTSTPFLIFDSSFRGRFENPGSKDAQITVELEEDAEYSIKIDDVEAGVMKTNLGGKLAISVELEQSEQVAVEIKKK